MPEKSFGDCEDAGGNSHGFFRDTDGTFRRIDFPGAYATAAFGISNNGDIVGLYGVGGNGFGFLLDRDGNFTSIADPDAVFTQATGINDSGEIVGTYCLTLSCIETFLGAQGFLATPAP